MSGQGLRDASSALYTMITKRKCAPRHTSTRCVVRHTSLRSAQYLQRGGLLWDTPPRDLHSNCQCFQALYLFRRCALRHTSARSAQFLQVFLCVGHVFFQFWRCVFPTPPCDLHSFYNNICVSEVCPTRDFIILNKGLMTPPWRERAKRSQGHAGFRILIRFLSRVGADAADTGVPVAPPSKSFLCCCAYSMREF